MSSYEYRNSYHKNNRVSRGSHLYHENPYAWKDDLYTELGPCTLHNSNDLWGTCQYIDNDVVYQQKNSHYKDKQIVSWPSYLYTGNPYTLGYTSYWNETQGPDSTQRWCLTSKGNTGVEIRWSFDHLISTRVFPKPVRRHLCIVLGPRMHL